MSQPYHFALSYRYLHKLLCTGSSPESVGAIALSRRHRAVMLVIGYLVWTGQPRPTTVPLALKLRDMVFGGFKTETHKIIFEFFFLFLFLQPLCGTKAALGKFTVMAYLIMMFPWTPVSTGASKLDPSHLQTSYLILQPI